jgi:GT2 family glycosyltransferase
LRWHIKRDVAGNWREILANRPTELLKLSIVIICWNDWKVVGGCLRSIYERTHSIDFEVIVSDNGSTDGSVQLIRENFPDVRIVENGANLGFAKGNNAGIRAAKGQFVLILNPDTIIHDGSLDRWIEFADRHPETGAFGCRVLNMDGSYQDPARPFPTIWRNWIAALFLRPLAHVSDLFVSDSYIKWKGDSERHVDWQSGCCVLFRGDLIKQLGGFDEQFFYQYEDVDLCHRSWKAGHPVLFTPTVAITHLGGTIRQWRLPIQIQVEVCRNCYRYFYKYYGKQGVRRCRRALLASLRLRQFGYNLLYIARRNAASKDRLKMYRVAILWNARIDPVRFVENGEEPEIGFQTIIQVA